jgi:PatG C-terminal
MYEEEPTMTDPQHPPDSSTAPETHAPCAACAQAALQPVIEQFVFTIGKLDVRLPTVGIEREYRRCVKGEERKPASRGERMRAVFEANHHLAARACYVLSIGGTPAFSLTPSIQSARESLIAALSHIDSPNHWVVVIGKLGPTCRPGDCGGLLVPFVFCDQIFCFSIDEWIEDMQKAVGDKPATTGDREMLASAARDLFNQSVNSLQNIGLSDAHRALNFLLMRHPGIFHAVAERRGKAILDRVDTRVSEGLGARRQILVILTFLNITTGVPDRLFCRVDVTEEWPFLADQPDGSPAPFGLIPFVESEFAGTGL